MQTSEHRKPQRHSRSTPASHLCGNAFAAPAASGNRLDHATQQRLEPRFGHSLAAIRIHADSAADHLSRNLNADAFTVGQDIFFAQGNYNPDSLPGQQIIAHEISHAVQQRGFGAWHNDLAKLNLSDRNSRFENEVHSATNAVLRGSAASLTEAPGPMISRWESGEHKHAVDDANIPPAMKGKIKLANGIEATPGEITAMMGDLYARFAKGADGKEHFDPSGSFAEMNTADPKEMSKLISLIDKEASTGKITDSSDWEAATRHRRGDDGSYLEIAKKNNSHFSAPTADGTDNNMGAYSAFHKMALEAAQNGDMEQARALEASGDHFLTDRFSAGHNFEKNGVMKASGHDADGILANMAVKTAHDDMNANGIDVHDSNPADPHWTAYGDGKFASAGNAENAKRTKDAVAGSWNELAEVQSGKESAANIEKSGFGAMGAVPQYDIKNQERAEAVARHTSIPGLIWDYKGEGIGAAEGSLWREEGKISNSLGDGWDWTKKKAGQAWHAAGDAASWAGHEASQGAQWVGHEASQGVHAVGEAGSWVGHKAEEAWDAIF